MRIPTSVAAALLSCLCACSGCRPPASEPPGPQDRALKPYVLPKAPGDPEPTLAKGEVLIRGGTVMTAAGKVYAKGHVLLSQGKISAVGEGELPAPKGAKVIDATGMFVTPGIIDTHSHMGVYPMPGGGGVEDGNEASAPTTPHVWAEHSFWPQDPALWRAVTGGVTTIQVLPGSANLIGGRSFVAHLKPNTAARLMRFPGAPQGLKMACGENPKRVYGSKGREPMTRMANVAGDRAAFQKAWEYRRQWRKYERDLELWRERKARREQDKGGAPEHVEAEADKGKDKKPDKPDDPPDPPARDLGLETLVGVLDGKILVQNHCYRADEMSLMLDLAQEYGFKIRSFHHALEAYKIAGRLAKEGVAVSTWADWWGFKLEAFDGVAQNAAMVHAAGARAVIHSDSSTEVRRLNQEAAKARAAGARVGIPLSDDAVLRWVTANAAWVLGIDDKVGTLEKGKLGDVVVWKGHPFSVYSLATHVFVDGELVYDRSAKDPHLSDFELGQVDPEVLP